MNLEMNFVEGLRRREYPYNPNADLHIFYNLFLMLVYQRINIPKISYPPQPSIPLIVIKFFNSLFNQCINLSNIFLQDDNYYYD